MIEKSKNKNALGDFHKQKEYVIDSVHLSLPVKFEKQNELFISTRDINGKKGKKISINYDINMVEIESDKDHILIPLSSVRGIYLLSPLKLEQIEISKNQWGSLWEKRIKEIK